MSGTRTAHAQVIDGFGAADVFRPADLTISAPPAGYLQIRVAATSVNPVDLQTRSGKVIPAGSARFPMVLGWDVAGVIEQIGDGVDGWNAGDRVAAMTGQPAEQNGAFTELINLSADLVARVPDSLELERAATIPLTGLTASQLLRTVDLPSGATMLVNGPTGAVGRLVMQLASHGGVAVIAITKPADQARAIELGAAQVVERGDFTGAVRELYPDGVDAAIDVVGHDAAAAALGCVRDRGVFATVYSNYDDPGNNLQTQRGIRFDNVAVHPDTAELTTLLQRAGSGELATPIEQTYPLSDAAQAHRRQEHGGLAGKLVLKP